MSNQSIFLTRKDFQTAASAAFVDLYESNEFTDITLVSEDGETIQAHKLIISASSGVLRKLIEKNRTPFLDVKHSFLRLLLQFIYTGQCEVNQIDLVYFLSTAKQLDIAGLGSSNGKDSPKEVIKDRDTEFEKSPARQLPDDNNKSEIIHNVEDIINGVIGEQEVIYTNTKRDTQSVKEITEADEYVSLVENDDIKKRENSDFVDSIIDSYEQPNLKPTNKRKLKKDKLLLQHAKYKCGECTYLAKHKVNMKHHVISVHNGRIHFCKTDNCELEYKYEENEKKILLHYRMNSCSICGVKFSKKDLDIHVKTHMLDGMFCCNVCEYKNKCKANLKRHKYNNHLKIDYICEICSFRANKFSELKRHKQNLHYAEPGIKDHNKVCCEICGKYLKGQQYLRKHMKTHNNKIEHKCKYCTKTFRDEKKLEIHSISARCTLKRPCNICGEHIANMQSALHRETHKVDGQFSCDLCDYRAKNTHHVKWHKDAIHKGVVYECNTDGCQYKSRWPSDLKTHKENIHEKIRHTCNICGITTGTKPNLYQHQYNVHKIRNKNYCDKCGKRFQKSSTFLAHPCYTDIMDKYRCDICGEKMKNSDSLATHMAAIHAIGPKAFSNYQCPFCNYAQVGTYLENWKRGSFLRHLRRKHNVNTKDFLQKNIEKEDASKKVYTSEDQNSRKVENRNDEGFKNVQ